MHAFSNRNEAGSLLSLRKVTTSSEVHFETFLGRPVRIISASEVDVDMVVGKGI
jgi:hypothetical protein